MRVLLFEPNPHHYEVIPGFAYYFLHMGYDVDCLTREEMDIDDLFSKCMTLKKQICFYCFEENEWGQKIRDLENNIKYDLLFVTSLNYWQGDHFRDLYRELIQLDNSRFGVIGCYHTLEDLEDGPISEKNGVVLSAVNSEQGSFNPVNANYFCDEDDIKSKNQTVRIVSIGWSVNRHALWHGIKSAEKNSGITNLCLICIAREKPKPVNIIKYLIRKCMCMDIPGYYMNWPPLLSFWISDRRIRLCWALSFKEMYSEIENADFLDASIVPELEYQFSSCRTSGVKQLSLGFLKPCIIKKSIADYYGFTDSNAIIYEEGGLEGAFVRAASMSDVDYQKMVAALKDLRDEIREQSEINLKNIICSLEQR